MKFAWPAGKAGDVGAEPGTDGCDAEPAAGRASEFEPEAEVPEPGVAADPG